MKQILNGIYCVLNKAVLQVDQTSLSKPVLNSLILLYQPNKFFSNEILKEHCNPLQGKYRFFTGNSLCSISTLTCFGKVQGLKGTNFIEIQGNICILYRNIALDIYIHVYVLITGISLLFEKQQHRILEKQGKPCKKNREKMFIKQENNITKTEKRCC